MKTNIVLVSLLERLNKKIATKISEEFELYFADIADILQYNLVNEGEIESLCGIDYLNNLKNKTIQEVASYENTLITIPYSLFISEKNAEYLNKYGTIVFLKFPVSVLEKIKKTTKKETTKNEMEILIRTYNEHTALCEDVSDVVIDLAKSDFGFCYKKVKKVLDEYYL